MEEKKENFGNDETLEESAEKKDFVRTYESDIARTLKEESGSLSGVFIAEAEKKEASGAAIETDGESSGKKITAYLLSSALIIAALFLISFSVWRFFIKKTPPVEISSENLIPSDSEIRLDVTGLSPTALLSLLAKTRDAATGSLGNVASFNLYVDVENENAEPTKKVLAANDFFEAIDSRASGKLQRSLLPEFGIGAHLFDGNQPFLVFRVDSYENAFAGMMEWEKYLKNDLSVFFEAKTGGVRGLPASSGAGEIASSTGPAETLPLAPKSFEDTVVRNKDARVLRDRNGKTILIYAFLNRQTLLITTNENTFREILDRLSAAVFRG